MKYLLSFRAVTLQFGGITALSEVNWGVPHLGIYGVVGPNGAGKSTLFNLSTGIYKPASGTILFEDVELNKLKTEQIARLGVTRTFQNIRLLHHLSVLENLLVVTAHEREGTFFKSLFKTPKGRASFSSLSGRADALLDLVGLTHLRSELAVSLSYGDQRKLEIARALMIRPKLLLLDEPAAGMNPVEKNTLNLILKKVAEQDVTVVVIEHDMKFIMNACQHVTVINQGRVLVEGSPSEIQNNPKVAEIYLGSRSGRLTKNFDKNPSQ